MWHTHKQLFHYAAVNVRQLLRICTTNMRLQQTANYALLSSPDLLVTKSWVMIRAGTRHARGRTEMNMGFFKLREENQLDATECFIAIIICATCFGHSYAHHQELDTILVLLPHMVCNALVAGGGRSGAGQQAMCPG